MRTELVLLLLVFVALSVSCGKKGPPVLRDHQEDQKNSSFLPAGEEGARWKVLS